MKHAVPAPGNSARALSRIDNQAAGDAVPACAAPGKPVREMPDSRFNCAGANWTMPGDHAQEALAFDLSRALARMHDRTHQLPSNHSAATNRPAMLDCSEHGTAAAAVRARVSVQEFTIEAADRLDEHNGSCSVAHIFQEPGDWDSGELSVGPTARKPWRYTGRGVVAMRVLEGGSGWLHMAKPMAIQCSSATDAEGRNDVTPRRTTGLASPVDCKELSDTARKLCPGDWVCIQPGIWYMISGSSTVEQELADPGSDTAMLACHCIYFARAYNSHPASS
eukprot:CAMPEP_0119416224 /NCGR_PEP_ID=MMETSP1335-20130426/12139_1 /TAXON_ID=259385 /ORGANISM="Chrysoculter rhomboideus, Strain RCC1486" /LENGTH=278 /DNA_ID=CAMNT_0007441333 /DNA_START=21 /DNA_END=857 /DNA_ORIENTATION=-